MTNERLSLCSLPADIIRVISQYILDSEDASSYFGCGLRHLMHLRATCSHLNSVVLNLPIKLKLNLSSVHIANLYATEETSLQTVAELIMAKTEWKVSMLILTDTFLEEFAQNGINQLVKSFEPFRELFADSVHNFIFTCAENVQIVEHVLNFFHTFAFNHRTVISIRYFFDTEVSVSNNPDRASCRNYIHDLALTSYNELLPISSVLENCCTIQTLELNCRLTFSLSLLATFSHLSCLKLTNIGVVINEKQSIGVCLESVQSLEMVLEHFSRSKHLPALSNNFIVKHFPNLKSFRLLSRSRKSTLGLRRDIAICLPKSCESLFVSYQESLKYFGTNYLRNLGLSFTNVGNIKSLKAEFLQSLCHMTIENISCYTFIDVLESLTDHLLTLPDIQFISIGNFVGMTQSGSVDLNETVQNRDFNSATIQDWFQQNKKAFQSHNSLKYIVLGHCLMTFKTNTVLSKDWILLKELDRFNQGPRKLIPYKALIIDLSE